MKWNETAKREVESVRPAIALRDNILTPEVKKNGFGAVDTARFDASIEQIALTYQFKGERPKGSSVFDPSFLPAAAERTSD